VVSVQAPSGGAARARAAGCSFFLGEQLAAVTFRDVPLNAPYYERLGFTVVPPADQGPQLAALVAEEAERIPGDAPRVAMRRGVR
jgi:hypothetical protein